MTVVQNDRLTLNPYVAAAQEEGNKPAQQALSPPIATSYRSDDVLRCLGNRQKFKDFALTSSFAGTDDFGLADVCKLRSSMRSGSAP